MVRQHPAGESCPIFVVPWCFETYINMLLACIFVFPFVP